MHPRTPEHEIYRALGTTLELFYSADNPKERDFWKAKTNILLNALSRYTNEPLSLEEFSARWFEAEFGSRL